MADISKIYVILRLHHLVDLKEIGIFDETYGIRLDVNEESSHLEIAEAAVVPDYDLEVLFFIENFSIFEILSESCLGELERLVDFPAST